MVQLLLANRATDEKSEELRLAAQQGHAVIAQLLASNRGHRRDDTYMAEQHTEYGRYGRYQGFGGGYGYQGFGGDNGNQGFGGSYGYRRYG